MESIVWEESILRPDVIGIENEVICDWDKNHSKTHCSTSFCKYESPNLVFENNFLFFYCTLFLHHFRKIHFIIFSTQLSKLRIKSNKVLPMQGNVLYWWPGSGINIKVEALLWPENN